MVDRLTVLLDRDGNIGLVCSKGHEILGYELGELVGQNWFDKCLPERLREEVILRRKGLMDEIEPMTNYINPVVTKDGGEIVVCWKNTILKTSDGEILGTISVGRVCDEEELHAITIGVEKEVCQLIQMGMLEVKTIDEDGKFCYGPTEQMKTCKCDECEARGDCKVWH